jgi:hypothetical protein
MKIIAVVFPIYYRVTEENKDCRTRITVVAVESFVFRYCPDIGVTKYATVFGLWRGVPHVYSRTRDNLTASVVILLIEIAVQMKIISGAVVMKSNDHMVTWINELVQIGNIVVVLSPARRGRPSGVVVQGPNRGPQVVIMLMSSPLIP